MSGPATTSGSVGTLSSDPGESPDDRPPDDGAAGDPAPATVRPPYGPRALRARVPLRVTLVALLVALVAAALTATGFAATSLLRDYLLQQRNQEVVSYAQQLAKDLPLLQRACTTPDAQLAGRGTFLACVSPEDTFAELSDGRSSATTPDLPRAGTEVLNAYGQAPFTVRSDDGTTRWRVVVQPVTDTFTIVYGVDLSTDRAVLARLIALELVVGMAVLVVLGVAGYLLVRNSLRPLQDVERTAQAIAAGDLSRRVPVGDERTEVGRLSNALNGMLARIEGSFRAQQASEEQAVASEGRMRRFVADASHELRTPLTSIRGFAELHRQGAVRDPAEVQRLMQRIESEATRMGLLVEDLLQLARLDQQRPLDVVPVDLAELTEDALHDARAVQPDRPLDLVLDPSLTEVPVVLGDEARLRQVIGNLVTNALTHTPAGTPVTVRLSEPADDPDTVCVVVSDAGPGMSAADADRVFERFYRADTSRTRAAGGSGLGLSIVSSLVAAHGGRVELATAPGEGATFTVRLPRSGPGPTEV
ncbi:HAMP domain-containing sensor histidine kinase [Modestobacter sp. VKM Ac-2986]|uniref:sensor histidine kinase n=1 Tax=Modestobacter sp. VKM Ac-2986 TaxID=3004140 RepID=UPI0022AAC020|nr:HAMP domain-containing sensor histidine kinase [Modestobacter sp. VKM Ac-2986]MCZ2827843.1 HAMP domain-containing sensor histidine kinase [Modestobacter sp. VKM Ac-2986]